MSVSAVDNILALEIEGLSKSFLGNRVLTDVDLTIGRGEVHILVGQNGSGKSTLIKLLSGYHQPDPGGSVSVGGEPLDLGSSEHSYRAGCRFVHQDLGLVDTESVMDNFAFGSGFPTRLGTVRRRSVERLVVEDLRNVGLELDPRMLVRELKAAERTGLAIARALRGDEKHPPRLLVLDEPTATLPPEEVGHLMTTLRQAAARGVGILYVTHHLEEVFSIGDRVTILRDGRVVESCDVSSLTRQRLVANLVADEEVIVEARKRRAHPNSAAPVLSVQALSAGALREVSFSVAAGEIVGVAGLTGSGRESLLSAIFGGISRNAGLIIVEGSPLPDMRPDVSVKRGLAYLAADRKTKGGIMTLTARENLTLVGLGSFYKRVSLDRRAERQVSTQWMDRLEVRPARGGEAPLASFSGGNQQKILFGKWLRRGPRLFLLDEPTQGVDVGAKAVLHRALAELVDQGASAVISSTDTDELVDLCDRILVVVQGRLARQLAGDEITHTAVMHSFLSTAEDEVMA